MKVVILIFVWGACSVVGLYIAYGDHDFVGEDPVLAAELKRRMALIEPPPPDPSEIAPQLAPSATRKGQTPQGVAEATAGRAPNPHESGRRRNWNKYIYSYPDLKNRPETNSETMGRGDQPKYYEAADDWNSTNLYAMQMKGSVLQRKKTGQVRVGLGHSEGSVVEARNPKLPPKVAEQIIYGLQDRIKDLENFGARFNSSNQMRIAYGLRRLDLWYDEMVDFFDYSHRRYAKENKPSIKHASNYMHPEPHSKENPWYFPIIRHLIYYQEIQKRYINMIYTVEFIRKLYTEELNKQDEDGHHKIDDNTMSKLQSTKKPKKT